MKQLTLAFDGGQFNQQAVTAAAGVVQYQDSLAAGELLLRQTRRKLDTKHAVGLPCLGMGL